MEDHPRGCEQQEAKKTECRYAVLLRQKIFFIISELRNLVNARTVSRPRNFSSGSSSHLEEQPCRNMKLRIQQACIAHEEQFNQALCSWIPGTPGPIFILPRVRRWTSRRALMHTSACTARKRLARSLGGKGFGL